MITEPRPVIWHVSLNHIWEECPNCKVVNRSQEWKQIGFWKNNHWEWVNRDKCPECGQVFDWSPGALESVTKYSATYLKAITEMEVSENV